MSIFPKRVSSGDNVVIHNAFHLNNYKEGIYFPLLEINIIFPGGEKQNILSEVFPIVKAGKESDDILHKRNQEFKYKSTPLVVLGRFFNSNDSAEQLTQILNAIPSGKHFYHTFTVPENASAGRYLVETIHYINGEKFYSQNREEDFFYVEHLLVEYTGNKVSIKNNSTESCPVKYFEFGVADDKIIYSSIEELKAKEIREYSASDKAFIQYNEDRKFIPLSASKSIFPLQNPKLAFIEKPGQTIVFPANKTEAYELENEYQILWQNCRGIKSKQEILEMSSLEVYNDLLTEGLIIEKMYI